MTELTACSGDVSIPDSAVLQLLAGVCKAHASTSPERAGNTWEEIRGTFGSTASIVGPTGPTYSTDVIAIGKAELWLSCFENLATILGGDGIPQETMSRLACILERHGWRVIPERIVSLPISDTESRNWFFELFGDY
jgi:hypothetical protein